MASIVSQFRAAAYNAATAVIALPLSLISPARAVRYRARRRQYRAYLAGTTTGPNQNWRPRPKSADAESKRDMQIIIGRTRDQAQNNPYISGGIRRIVNNVVRFGIRPQFQFRDKNNQLAIDINRAWEQLFARWARYADISGHDSYWSQQRLGLSHMWFDGGFFIHRSWDFSIPGVVPLRLQLLERDHLDRTIDGALGNGNIARQGKELDPDTGRPQAYWLYPHHPGDYQYHKQHRSVRVPAADIIDVYERSRISQNHAIPWIVAIVMEAYDLEDYRSFERIGAKLAAAFGLFIKSNYPDMGHPGIGIQGTDENDEWPTTWDDQPDYIEPGRIQALPYGTDLTIASHSRPGTQYEPYVKESRRGQSVGLGMSYEAFGNDYTDASYSSARSGSLEERLSYQGQQFFLGEKFGDPVLAWFIEAAWLAGINPMAMPDYRFNPWPYHESVRHQGPAWTWQDPAKDGKASELKLSNYLSTHRREAANLGLDWDELIDERIAEAERLRPLLEALAANQQLISEINNGTENATETPAN